MADCSCSVRANIVRKKPWRIHIFVTLSRYRRRFALRSGHLFNRICNTCAAVGVSVFLAAGVSSASPQDQTTTTPIQHVVIIFDENNSFDHYFGTYPKALNPVGEPTFHAAPGTPTVNGLTPAMLTSNPNSVQPFRLDRNMATTCDNDNHYADEQKAYHAGLMDKFAETTSAVGTGCQPGLSMGYYDGNTVTALWNYAQYFAMSDNFFDTEFGTTVMGHLNLVAGQTHTSSVQTINGKVANGSIVANVEAGFDDCVTAATGTPVQMTSANIGDLLNAKGITWGWFYADFPQSSNSQPITTCPSTYNSHYAPFQYYQSTSNPHHLPPGSAAAIGTSADQANHNYTVNDFWTAAHNGNMPAVSFLKAAKPQTGHPADSTPLAEQQFLVHTINALQQLPEWKNMAILITYDDSDGWYDHVMPPIVNQSNDPAQDTLLGATGMCGTPAVGAYLDRCGYGTRLPLLVISPYARRNYVSHALNDLTSLPRFIEDNWGLGRLGDQSFDALAGSILDLFDFKSLPRKTKLLLNETTGEPLKK
jgi:phospholipase C